MKFCDENITSREKEVLKLIVLGYSNTEIAKQLYISVYTAQAHVRSIIKKFNTDNRIKVAVLAVKLGIV